MLPAQRSRRLDAPPILLRAERADSAADTVRFLRAIWLIAAKDIRIELSSRVITSQVLPFAGLVLLMFAFASDPDRSALRTVAPGMFWTSVILAALLAAARAATIESETGAKDALRLSQLDPSAIFLGKVAAVLAQLVVLEFSLTVGVVAVYAFPLRHPLVLVASAVAASVGIAAAGVLYATLASSLRVRDTLLPLLALPVLAPVALGASRAWTEAGQTGPSDGMRWVQLLVVFAAMFTAFGAAGYDALLEEG